MIHVFAELGVLPAMFSQEFTDKLSSLPRPATAEGKKIFAPFLEIFHEFLESLTTKFEHFKEEMIAINKTKDDEINVLKEQVNKKDTIITSLRHQIDAQDQYVRRESLIFSGSSIPTYLEGENCVDIARKLIHEKFGTETEVCHNDISVAHRLGPKPMPSKVDRRSIIVRLCRRNVKDLILNKSRKAKRKDLFVSESLTPTRLKIVRALKQAKNENPDIVSGYQTIDGSIYVWVKPPNPTAEGAKCSRVMLNTLEGLEEFCQRNFQEPATNYLPRIRDATRDESA